MYVALVEFYNATNLIKDYNVGTYSEEKIDLQMIKIDGNSYEKIEHLIWKNYCRLHYKEMNNKGTEVVSDR